MLFLNNNKKIMFKLGLHFLFDCKFNLIPTFTGIFFSKVGQAAQALPELLSTWTSDFMPSHLTPWVSVSTFANVR